MESMGINNIILEDAKRIAEELKKELSVLEGKTFLVTGGTGFICSYFLDVVYYLNENVFKNPCKIICLDNLANSKTTRIDYLFTRPYFTFINQDVSLPVKYQGDIDFIVHGASLASPTLYREQPIQTIDANSLGTRNMLFLALEKKVKSFVYISSSEIYGDPTENNVPTPETYWGNVSSIGPRSCYDESKRLGEALCMAFFNKHNVPVKIIRPFNIFGPGMTKDKRVMSDFINNGLKQEPIVMFSKGEDTRTFCYISDAIEGFFRVLLSDFNGEAFNIGNDEKEISMVHLAKLISQIFGGKLDVVQKINQDANYLKDNPKRRCPDLSKAKNMLNYRPKISLKTGIERTIKSGLV